FLRFQSPGSIVEQIREIGLGPGPRRKATVIGATEPTGTADRVGCPECDEPGRDEPGAYPVRTEGPRVGGTNIGCGAEKVRAGRIHVVLRSTATNEPGCCRDQRNSGFGELRQSSGYARSGNRSDLDAQQY